MLRVLNYRGEQKSYRLLIAVPARSGLKVPVRAKALLRFLVRRRTKKSPPDFVAEPGHEINY